MADNLSDKRLEEFLRDAPGASREEIAEFRQLVERYFLGELNPDEFKARRLHLGTYGIRGTKDIHMMRIKIPAGVLTAEQLECLADLAERYSKSIGHITRKATPMVGTRHPCRLAAKACPSSCRNFTPTMAQA